MKSPPKISRCKHWHDKPQTSSAFEGPRIAVFPPKPWPPISKDAAVLTLRDFIDFMLHPLRPSLTTGSLQQFRSLEASFSCFLERPALVADLNIDAVRAYLADCTAKNSPATVMTKRQTLVLFWRVAADEDMLPECRARKIPKVKVPPPLPESWTVEEVGRILYAARNREGSVGGVPAGLWWHSFLLVGYDTGERRTALLKTRTVDVDLDRQNVVFRYTKTARPRVCPLREQTVAALLKIYDPDRERMWPWPWSRQTFDVHAKEVFASARVSYGRRHGGSMHKLRKTAGTLTEANGGDGSRLIGNKRANFVKFYLDPRFDSGQLKYLPFPPIEETES